MAFQLKHGAGQHTNRGCSDWPNLQGFHVRLSLVQGPTHAHQLVSAPSGCGTHQTPPNTRDECRLRVLNQGQRSSENVSPKPNSTYGVPCTLAAICALLVSARWAVIYREGSPVCILTSYTLTCKRPLAFNACKVVQAEPSPCRDSFWLVCWVERPQCASRVAAGPAWQASLLN
jgi:hypothetical protein